MCDPRRRHWGNDVRRIAHMTRTMLTGVYLIGVTLFMVAGSASFAEERLEGQVVRTHLTACSPVSEKGGTCEGTLELEPQVGEEAERVTVQITRDTVLKKGEQKAFLFQLEGSHAAVTYVTEGAQKMATSVVAKPSGR
jgi:hypothetical protein